MYRLLIPVLLYFGAVVGAPQDSDRSVDSDIKINQVNETFQNVSAALTEHEKEVENNDLNRDIENDDVTTELDQSEITTEVAESVTELGERRDQAVLPAKVKTQTKSPSPRFYSKLSYFQKPTYTSGSLVTNLVEQNGKRKFKSRCRCEKIWNCPKLQITVPRCPDEYFMCCF